MLNRLKQIFVRIYEIQSLKIQKKGLKNILIAYCLLFMYFYFVPIYAKTLWPQKIQNKVMFQVGGSWIIPFFSTLLFTLMYLPGYLGVKAYKKYQIQPNLKKPWEKQNWSQMKTKTFWNLLVNFGIIFPLYIYVGLMVAGTGLNFEGFPSHWQIIRSVFIVMLADDFVYMILHRLFHEIPFMYRFHKVHHQYDTVFSMIGQYAHPVEEIFGNLLPGTIVFSFYKVHIFVLFFWMVYKMYNSAEGHCGYEFPWSPTRVIPLLYGASYHDFHHSKNIGNYATSFYLFQLIANTNKIFFDRELAEGKKQLKSS